MANGGARTAVLLAGTLLGACSSLGGGPESAPPAELEPAGWLEPRTALDSETFVVGEDDWLAAVRHLARQAAAEHDTLLLGGVSLGAVLTLDVALDPDSDVDALLALSPAYGLASWRLIRWAPLLRHLRARLDDAAAPAVDVPWMLVQSRDDAIVDTAFNRETFAAHAASGDSVLVELGVAAHERVGEQRPAESGERAAEQRLPVVDAHAGGRRSARQPLVDSARLRARAAALPRSRTARLNRNRRCSSPPRRSASCGRSAAGAPSSPSPRRTPRSSSRRRPCPPRSPPRWRGRR